MGPLGELGSVGWPAGLAVAAAFAGHRLLEARRRAALNGALHELRRPLQTLALAPPPEGRPLGPGPTELALAALDELDREINGSPRSLARRPVACRALVESAVERWRGPAAQARRSLELRWRGGTATVMADPYRVAQALDNLLANAIEHGGLRVWIETAICGGNVRISVSNAAPRAPAPRSRRRRPGRGHGLRVVAAIAADHGGRFAVRRSRTAWAATLELPLAQPPLAEAKPAETGVREHHATAA
jgi:signal transduction histidine kinase